MQDKPIHIISFDNPYPPVYGGAIDVFYKLRALHGVGYKIYLHCYTDKPVEDFSELGRFVEQVYFYERKKKGHKLFALSPFSVASRYNEALVENLRTIDAPLLFEGLQSTYLLQKHTFGARKKYLRLMNLESNYFGGLRRSENNPAKKIILGIESLKYALYQKMIGQFDAVFTLSLFETDYVGKFYRNAHYVPVFHGNDTVAHLAGFGKYAFYHGDLRMADNRRAAQFLIRVFKQIPDYPLVIASNRGKRMVKREIGDSANISHTTIRNQQHLDQMMAEAHISVMLSFQQSGTKLKSVNSLYKSRHCIINANMVDDENIRALCTMAETEEAFIAAIRKLKNEPYSDFEKRRQVLGEVMDDEQNARKIAAVIENHKL